MPFRDVEEMEPADPLLGREALLRAMIATPSWWAARELLILRKEDLARRALRTRNIDALEMARVQQEYDIVCELLANPVEWLMQHDDEERER